MWQCRECAGGTSYTTKVQRKERVSAAWPKPDDSGRNLVNIKWMEARFHRTLSQSARGPPGQGHASFILFSPYSLLGSQKILDEAIYSVHSKGA